MCISNLQTEYYTIFDDKDTNTQEWGILRYPHAKSSGSYTIPSEFRFIAAYVFEGCKFDQIHIPVTVKVVKNMNQYTNDDEVLVDYTFCMLVESDRRYGKSPYGERLKAVLEGKIAI